MTKKTKRKVNARYYERNKEKLKAKQRIYYEVNQDMIKGKACLYKEKNKEYIREYQRENRDKINQYARQWAKENPEKIQTIQQRFRENNPEKVRDWERASKQRRENRKKNLPATLTQEEWQTILDNHFGCCHYCGKKSDNLHQEHKVPISKGGGYTASNIVPTCQPCNSAKRDRDYKKFAKNGKNRLQLKLFED